MAHAHHSLRDASPAAVRQLIRSKAYTGHTAGLGQGHMQANLVILPADFALDFLRYCQRNPKPCPVLGITDTGDPRLHTLGHTIDLRTDLPAYNVYRNGQLDTTQSDILEHWTDTSVGIALGCSFGFEHALQRHGFSLWHIDHDKTVPMYRTNLATLAAGPFAGDMVVSMRSVPADRLDDARRVAAQYPLAHGAPVHWGEPAAIGIASLSRPDWGDAPPPLIDQIPVFWACGVTPQVAIENARIPLCITHKPGHMLITDVPEFAESPVLTQADESLATEGESV
ncbi:MAG: putative hydro-lyase [Pseudomonadota bacterium]